MAKYVVSDFNGVLEVIHADSIEEATEKAKKDYPDADAPLTIELTSEDKE